MQQGGSGASLLTLSLLQPRREMNACYLVILVCYLLYFGLRRLLTLMKTSKHPMGQGRITYRLFGFFSARETGEIAPVCQDKFYKKCQVSHKPSRTIKKIIRNMKKMSRSNQTAAPSEISHAWRIQVSEQTCGGHVPTNDSHWFYRCCSCIAQRRFPNSLSIHTAKSTALKPPPSPEPCS